MTRLAPRLANALRGHDGPDDQILGRRRASHGGGGIPSPFAIDDLSIIGFTAIPRRLPTILRRIRETADAIIAARPDVLVIIDSPDFTHRVARRFALRRQRSRLSITCHPRFGPGARARPRHAGLCRLCACDPAV